MTHAFSFPPILQVHAVELPPMEDDELDVAVVSIFVAPIDPEALFTKATVYESLDGGVTYDPILVAQAKATMGQTRTELSGAGALGHQWDRRNSCEVELFSGSMTSFEAADPAVGRNLLLIGDEALICRDVELVRSRTWAISHLSRGRRDTAIVTHPAGSRVIALRMPGRIAYKIPASEVGIERRFKAVAAGGNLNSSLETAITPTGKSFTPLPPPSVAKVRHVPATNDWTITPAIVTRSPRVDMLSIMGYLDPDPMDWHVRIRNRTGQIVDEFDVSGAKSFVYTVAQQTAALGAPATNLQGQVARKNRHGALGQYTAF